MGARALQLWPPSQRVSEIAAPPRDEAQHLQAAEDPVAVHVREREAPARLGVGVEALDAGALVGVGDLQQVPHRLRARGGGAQPARGPRLVFRGATPQERTESGFTWSVS